MSVSRVAALRTLVHSGVHGEHWPKHVYAVAMYSYFTDKDYIMAKNNEVHAEEDILDYFKVLLQRRILRPQKITLFLSSSPCHRCSQRIISFLEKARGQGIDLEIEVVISAFYKIRRPSCVDNPACQGHLPSENDHKAQLSGLRDLKDANGVVLRTTTNEDWDNLAVTLDLDDIDLSRREKIDDLLRKDFRELMSRG